MPEEILPGCNPGVKHGETERMAGCEKLCPFCSDARETELYKDKAQCVQRHSDAKRVIAWLHSKKRKGSNTAFTSGPDRDIAREIEMVLLDRDDARVEANKLRKKLEEITDFYRRTKDGPDNA